MSGLPTPLSTHPPASTVATPPAHPHGHPPGWRGACGNPGAEDASERSSAAVFERSEFRCALFDAGTSARRFPLSARAFWFFSAHEKNAGNSTKRTESIPQKRTGTGQKVTITSFATPSLRAAFGRTPPLRSPRPLREKQKSPREKSTLRKTRKKNKGLAARPSLS